MGLVEALMVLVALSLEEKTQLEAAGVVQLEMPVHFRMHFALPV